MLLFRILMLLFQILMLLFQNVIPKNNLKKKREVCSDWVTAEVIAARIGRDVNYVKNHVLPNLADVIEKMYDIPHHPRQKYRAKQEEGDA